MITTCQCLHAYSLCRAAFSFLLCPSQASAFFLVLPSYDSMNGYVALRDLDINVVVRALYGDVSPHLVETERHNWNATLIESNFIRGSTRAGLILLGERHPSSSLWLCCPRRKRPPGKFFDRVSDSSFVCFPTLLTERASCV